MGAVMAYRQDTPAETPTDSDMARVQVLLLAEYDRLLALIRKHLPATLRPPVEAEDVLQDTYFEAFRQQSELVIDDDSSVFRFLSTVARRRVAALIRRDRVVRRVIRGGEGVEDDGELADLLSQLASHRRSPSGSAAAHEFMRELEEALAALPESQRTAVTMRYVQGHKPQEIADAMGCSVAGVHQLCNRGLNGIRLALRSASHYV
jgi:RNA polymerase sigma-70 factor (ECF subfamily)